MKPRLKYSDSVKFEPWIQCEEFDLTSPRILFVGESHYTSRKQSTNRELTRLVVERARKGKLSKKSGKRFFTNIAAVMNGRLLSPEEKAKWWCTVAFYNYIQVPVGSRPRSKLTLDKFSEAHGAFQEVITSLKPDIIVVLGRRVWKHMSAEKARKVRALDCRCDSVYRELWEYEVGGGGTALTLHVKHPSAGFNYKKFMPLMSAVRARHEERSSPCRLITP